MRCKRTLLSVARSASWHPLEILRRHTLRSSDTTLAGPWLCCRLDLLHLSSLHCLPRFSLLRTPRKCVCVDFCKRVMSHLRSLQTYCPLLLLPSLATLARAAVASQLCPISAPPFQGAPLVRTPFLLGSPAPGAARLPLASGRKNAPAMTNLPFLHIDRHMLEHDVPVVFCGNV